MDKIYFAKRREDAVIPTKNIEDGGYDIYAVWNNNVEIIKPHECKMFATGLSSAFSSDYVALLRDRGSVGTKNIQHTAGVIDSGYRGEWFVPLSNANTYPVAYIKEIDEYGNLLTRLVREVFGLDFDVSDFDSMSSDNGEVTFRFAYNYEYRFMVSERDSFLYMMKRDTDGNYPVRGKVKLMPQKKAITQVLMVEVPKMEVMNIPLDELMAMESIRGEGALGSSNK